jgi:hypothetical protein
MGAAVLMTTLLGNAANAAAGETHTELAKQLVEQGWQTSPDGAGNVLLRPPAIIPSAGTAPVPVIAQSTAANPPDLQQLLRQRGWVIRESPAGTTLQLLIDPPAAASTQPQAVAQPAGSRAEDVYRLLEERGWRVRQDASGDTLLIPVGGSAPSSSDGAAPSVGTGEASMTDFQRAVESTGWRVESAADGSLVMYPPGSSAAKDSAKRRATSADGGCPGSMSPSVAEGSVALPITDESVVRQLVREWLAGNYPAGHAVGRLRRINRTYVVSIVDDEPPFQLRNQLIVRTDNGRIIAVY